jgi:ABC-type transport system involved in multi-copper enzyme maturation permease subunit
LNLATVIVGHLAGPECRRALARGWLVVVRGLVGLALALALLFLIWIWWLATKYNPYYAPESGLLYTLATAALMLVTIVVVQAPAVLAGSLAGERERGVLQLLLTTAVSPREIVSGRLLGKLSQVAMVVLGGLPMLAVLFAWNGLGLWDLAVFFLLLSSAGFGGGGLAVGASVVSRRGRDALLSVYCLMLVLVLSPLLSWVGLPVGISQWLLWFNPFYSTNALVFDASVGPALATSAFWMAIGVAGMIVAAWRLRPSCLAAGEVVKKSRRGAWVPALGDRPMLWKELYIERVGTLGRFGRWMGILITMSLGGGSLALAAIIAWDLAWGGRSESSMWATNFLSVILKGASGRFMGWLLQWAIGLRAAVSIASERERGTWDALLMSPLQAGEIVRAKVWGSMHALRFMVAAMVVAWTLGLITGAVSVRDYTVWITDNTLMGILMAAVGVRLSLALPTATKAMTWTIGSWLFGMAAIAVAAGSLMAVGWMSILAIWSVAVQYGYASLTPPASPISISTAWVLANDLVIVVVELLIILDTSVRFDRIAGRMAAGAVATTVDQFLYGGPIRPVFLPSKTSRRNAPIEDSPADPPKAVLEELPKHIPAVDVVAAE